MSELQTTLADLLRSCVQCGLCLPHCATFLGTGNEVQSPRGRLLLLADLFAHEGQEAPDSYLAAFDQCIGCRACETVCPSGVPFSLMEYGHHLAAAQGGKSGQQRPQPAVPGPVLRRLDSADFLGVLGRAGAAVRYLLRVLFGYTWRRKLATGPTPVAHLTRLLNSLPASPASDAKLEALLDDLVLRTGAAVSPRLNESARSGHDKTENALLFFSGCASAGLLPATSRRLVAALNWAGFIVSFPTGQDCCGALAAHTGRMGRAAILQRRNQNIFATPAGQEPTPIVVEAAGCGLELTNYDADFSARIKDAITLLATSGLQPLRPVPLRVALHDPCHARHGQKVVSAPRELLAAIPDLTWCEAEEKEVCCGSGGAWGLRYPELSADLAQRKAVDLAATGADLIVTTNPGCLGQIHDGLALEAPEIPILPLTDLWWYACLADGK